MRKNISFKIENLTDKEQAAVDAWAEEQKNITQSLANLVLHSISWVGNTDIMDFEIQQKLHSILPKTKMQVYETVQDFRENIEKEIKERQVQVIDQAELRGESKKMSEKDDVISKATDLFEEN